VVHLVGSMRHSGGRFPSHGRRDSPVSGFTSDHPTLPKDNAPDFHQDAHCQTIGAYETRGCRSIPADSRRPHPTDAAAAQSPPRRRAAPPPPHPTDATARQLPVPFETDHSF
jgi:hypothetical protein